jgi:GlpG protein
VLFFPNTVILGASGIVFSFIILSSITGFRERTIPLTFLLVAALYLGQQIYNATQNNNVAELAHIAGGVVGGSLGFVMKKNKMDRYHNGNVR